METRPPILEIRRLAKAFGGLKVTHDVSFAVRKGELSAIIGPNGAGKTTLFNLITGKLVPDGGEVLYKEERIDGLHPADIARRGSAGRSRSPASSRSAPRWKTYWSPSSRGRTGRRA